jgi:hypothetical protein
MAKPAVRKHETLTFSNAEETTISKKNGNFKKTRVCNGKIEHVLAKEFGVLAVLCRRNNGGQVTPPPTDGLIYTVIVEIPNSILGGNGNQNGGITTLVELFDMQDPNVTVSETATSTFVNVLNAGIGIAFTVLT